VPCWLNMAGLKWPRIGTVKTQARGPALFISGREKVLNMSRTKLIVRSHTNCCGAVILVPGIEKEKVVLVYNPKTYQHENVKKLVFQAPTDEEETAEIFSQAFHVRANNYVNFLFVPTEFCELMAARAARSKHWKRVGKSAEGECWIYGRGHANVG